MSKVKLSIYLIKKGFNCSETVTEKAESCSKVELDDGSIAYIKISEPHVPAWVNSFFGAALDSEMLQSSSASVLYLLSADVGGEDGESRVFAVSFGYGYTLLEKDAIEERFGMKVALNQATNGELRKIKRTSITGNARKTDEQMPFSSTIDAFGIDVERDLLDGVTVGGGDHCLATGSITGSDSLSLSVDQDRLSIRDFLDDVYKVYTQDNYKEKFSWVDRIVPVRNRSLIDGLNNEVVKLIRDRDSAIWMAVPEILEWEAVAGFEIGASEKLYDDVYIDDVVSAMGDASFDYDSLKGVSVKVIGQAGDSVLKRWQASDCLYGELAYKGEQYCINNGKWFLVDADFKKQIEQRYEKISLCGISFPDCNKGESEGSYNERAAAEDRAGRLLMDKKTVFYGGGGSQVELCDILCLNGTFVHVKHYAGSSTLSHLFNQGYVSAQLIKSDYKFRVEAQKKIDSVSGPPFSLGPDSVQEVVYAIISKKAGDRPEIPFFSKVSLDSICTRLESMRIKVSLAAISEQSS